MENITTFGDILNQVAQLLNSPLVILLITTVTFILFQKVYRIDSQAVAHRLATKYINDAARDNASAVDQANAVVDEVEAQYYDSTPAIRSIDENKVTTEPNENSTFIVDFDNMSSQERQSIISEAAKGNVFFGKSKLGVYNFSEKGEKVNETA